MDAIVFVILGFMVGSVLGYRIADAIHKHVIADLLKRAGVTPDKLEQVQRELLKEIDPDQDSRAEIEIRAEQMGTEIFVYRKSDGQFLAQGRSHDEILGLLKSRLGNHRFTITAEDGAQYLQKP